MVEVIYHGRSLETDEKATIQTEVARLIDRILKGNADSKQIVSVRLKKNKHAKKLTAT